jgi:AGZA family xanthine/uracil permease-like MFS transporter
MFIGFEIVRQAYRESPPEHSEAVSFSFLPVIASLIMIILPQFTGAAGITPDKLPARLGIMLQTLTVLSNGFILTALLWGGMLAFVIDRKPRMAALYSLVCAVLTLFGLIHSVLPTGEVYLPWRVASHLHYTIVLGYVLLAATFLLLGIGSHHEDQIKGHE